MFVFLQASTLLSSLRCFQECSQIWHVHGCDDDVRCQHASPREYGPHLALCGAAALFNGASFDSVASQGLSFHLGVVLITLGFITYVEHGETQPLVLLLHFALLCTMVS